MSIRSLIDGIDSNFSVILPMPLHKAVSLSSLHLEDTDLGMSCLSSDGAAYAGPVHHRCSDGARIIVSDEKDITELELRTRISSEFFHPNTFSGFDSYLFSACSDYRVHNSGLPHSFL